MPGEHLASVPSRRDPGEDTSGALGRAEPFKWSTHPAPAHASPRLHPQSCVAEVAAASGDLLSRVTVAKQSPVTAAASDRVNDESARSIRVVRPDDFRATAG